MGIFNKLKKTVESGKKAVVKSKVKSAVNQKFDLDGKFDEQLDEVSDKVLDKVGVDNIIKAKQMYDKLNKK